MDLIYYVHAESHVSGMQNKKRKKKAATPARDEEGLPTVKPASPPPQASQSKSASKKAKAKGKKKDEGDDLDKALAELSIKCVALILVLRLSHS